MMEMELEMQKTENTWRVAEQVTKRRSTGQAGVLIQALLEHS